MRFSKRGRGPLSWGRRPKRTPREDEFVPVDTREREALLGVASNGGMAELPSAAGSVEGNDPARQLLTTLGRLQRLVSRARDGRTPETWADDCMNQLIDAVEIALLPGWDELADALAETGRILQSCENANSASHAVPFLGDSCGIFCLLASNPVKGRTWESMLTKWRQRYDAALAELAKARIPLVRDEDDSDSATREGISQSAEHPFDLPSDIDSGFDDDPADALPALDDLPSLEEAAAVTAGFASNASDDSETEFGNDDQPVARGANAQADESSSQADFQEISPNQNFPGLEELDPLEPLEPLEPLGQDSRADKGDSLAADVVEILDTLCDGLSRIERKGSGDIRTTTLAMEEGLTFLRERADTEGRLGAVAACETMERLLGLSADAPDAIPDRFFELAYGFCGVYADAKELRDDPAIQGWIRECETLIVDWPDAVRRSPLLESPVPSGETTLPSDSADAPAIQIAPPQAAPSATVGSKPADDAASEPFPRVPEVRVNDGSAQSLLEDAQHAIAEGRSDAELLALRAAASIARAKTERSEKNVRETEASLQRASLEIERARQGVERAEEDVTKAETDVRETKDAVARRQKELEQIRADLSALEQSVREVETQIRALQEKQAALSQKGIETRRALDGKSRELDENRRRVDESQDAEETARTELENARQRVKHFEQKRSEAEAAMMRSRDVLTRQRESLADIEDMIERLGASSSPDDANGLLFDF